MLVLHATEVNANSYRAVSPFILFIFWSSRHGKHNYGYVCLYVYMDQYIKVNKKSVDAIVAADADADVDGVDVAAVVLCNVKLL